MTLQSLLEKQMKENQDEVVCPDVISGIQKEILDFIKNWAEEKKENPGHAETDEEAENDIGYNQALADLINLLDIKQ